MLAIKSSFTPGLSAQHLWGTMVNDGGLLAAADPRPAVPGLHRAPPPGKGANEDEAKGSPTGPVADKRQVTLASGGRICRGTLRARL